MKGSFSIGLLEVLAYLAPGLVGIFALYIFYQGSISNITWPNDWNVLYILIGAYIAGHVITILSRPAVWIRGIFKKLVKLKRREERYSFYSLFEKALEEYLGYTPMREDHYPFSLRVVAENCAESNKSIDRLFALTLFSRNMLASFLGLSLSLIGARCSIHLRLYCY